MLRYIAWTAIAASLIGVLSTAALSYRLFFRHHGRIAQTVDSVDGCDRQVAAERQSLLRHLAGTDFERVAVRGALAQVADHPSDNLTWNVQFALWIQLLPRLVSKTELATLYGHFLPLSGGHGLCFGAKTHFARPAQNLSDLEIAELVAISRSPARLSSKEGRRQAPKRAEQMLASIQ